MHCRERANPRRGEIERLAGATVRTAEQKQVRSGLEAVFDPVLRLGEERPLELSAGRGLRPRRSFASQGARDYERAADNRSENREAHRGRPGRQ
jgi:hypothetical protein